jgi:hypothetical protein
MDIRHAKLTTTRDDGTESAVTMTLFCNPTSEELAALLDAASTGSPVTTPDGRIRCFQCYFAERTTCVHLTLKTHYGLGADAILDITYDYDGPSGCQRKHVTTADMVYTYHQIGSSWVIAQNKGIDTAPALW